MWRQYMRGVCAWNVFVLFHRTQKLLLIMHSLALVPIQVDSVSQVSPQRKSSLLTIFCSNIMLGPSLQICHIIVTYV